MFLHHPSSFQQHAGPHTPSPPKKQLLPPVRASKRQARRKGSRGSPSQEDVLDMFSAGDIILPTAPEPGAIARPKSEEPTDIYPVFKPAPGSRETWKWDDDGRQPAYPENPEAVIPLWNPKTGFQRVVEQPAESSSIDADGQAVVQGNSPLPSTASSSGQQQLSSVSKNQVLSSCISTGLGLGVAGFLIRNYSNAGGAVSSALGTDPALLQDLLRIPPGFESWQQLGLALGLTGVVTGARLSLLLIWPEFRYATNLSNRQVLSPLGPLDVMLVACVSGLSEEWLFRAALIPASWPDWRGVALSAAVFGLLHNSGGRNLAFAAWAGVVGAMYGAAFLFTHNLWVPVAAHSLSNLASAAAWKRGGLIPPGEGLESTHVDDK